MMGYQRRRGEESVEAYESSCAPLEVCLDKYLLHFMATMLSRQDQEKKFIYIYFPFSLLVSDKE